MSLTPAEVECRNHDIRLITDTMLTHARGRYVGKIVGSQRTGTSCASSDIDIALIPLKEYWHEGGRRMAGRSFLKRLYHKLSAPSYHNIFADVVIQYSHFPLVSLRIVRSGQRVQIVFPTRDDYALAETAVAQSLELHPDILPILITVRQSLEVRGLNDVFRGGIGSYTLLNMIRASIELKPANSLGQNFLNFLQFYAQFDSTKYGISLCPPGIHEKIRGDETVDLSQPFEQLTPETATLETATSEELVSLFSDSHSDNGNHMCLP
jgi:non-canonical poly(A) RNA polymerase PAPD5/7